MNDQPDLVAPSVRRLARLSTGRHFLAFAVEPPRAVQLTAAHALLVALVLEKGVTAEGLKNIVERKLAGRATPLDFQEVLDQLVASGLLKYRTTDTTR